MKLVQPNAAATQLAVRFRSETAVNVPLGRRVRGLIPNTVAPAPATVWEFAEANRREDASFKARIRRQLAA